MCHQQAVGGGMLTQYGREGGRAFLSTWSEKEESRAAYGLLHAPCNLVQADFRYLFTGDTGFLMQAEGSVGMIFEHLQLVATGGSYAKNQGSRIHYVMMQRGGWSIRAGKFDTAFNVDHADHTAFNRRLLGFGPGRESYGAEFLYESKYFSGLVSFQVDDYLLRLGTNLDRYAIGVSGLYRPKRKEVVVGGWLLAGPSPHFYLLQEVDNVRSTDPLIYKNQMISFTRLGTFPLEGFDLYLTRQWTAQDFQNEVQMYMGGITWSPRPHFEFTGEYGVVKRSGSLLPRSLFLFHFWL